MNQNAAYDMSLFEPRQEYKRTKKKEKLKILPQAKKRRVGVAAVFKSVTVGALVMAALCFVVISNVQLTELTDNISTMQTRLNNAKSEQIALQMKLQSRMSLKSVENYAVNKLGLSKVQNYQITYININGGDKVEVSDKNTHNTFKDLLLNIVDNVKAYFGLL